MTRSAKFGVKTTLTLAVPLKVTCLDLDGLRARRAIRQENGDGCQGFGINDLTSSFDDLSAREGLGGKTTRLAPLVAMPSREQLHGGGVYGIDTNAPKSAETSGAT